MPTLFSTKKRIIYVVIVHAGAVLKGNSRETEKQTHRETESQKNKIIYKFCLGLLCNYKQVESKCGD